MLELVVLSELFQKQCVKISKDVRKKRSESGKGIGDEKCVDSLDSLLLVGFSIYYRAFTSNRTVLTELMVAHIRKQSEQNGLIAQGL